MARLLGYVIEVDGTYDRNIDQQQHYLFEVPGVEAVEFTVGAFGSPPVWTVTLVPPEHWKGLTYSLNRIDRAIVKARKEKAGRMQRSTVSENQLSDWLAWKDVEFARKGLVIGCIPAK